MTGSRSLENSLSRGACRVVLRISEHWKLTRAQTATLMGTDETTIDQWWMVVSPHLSADQLRRAGVLLDMFQALHGLFSDPEQANSWVKGGNRAFEGRSALDVMLGGRLEDLEHIRDHLRGHLHGVGGS